MLNRRTLLQVALLLAGCALPKERKPNPLHYKERPKTKLKQISIDSDPEAISYLLDRHHQLATVETLSAPWANFTDQALFTGATMFPKLEPHRVHTALAALTGEQLQWDNAYPKNPGSAAVQTPVLLSARGIFINHNDEVPEAIAEYWKTIFNTGYFAVDFTDPTVGGLINEWLTINSGADTIGTTIPPGVDILSWGVWLIASAWETPSWAATMPEFVATDGTIPDVDAIGTTATMFRGTRSIRYDLPLSGSLAMRIYTPLNAGTAAGFTSWLPRTASEIETIPTHEGTPVTITLPSWSFSNQQPLEGPKLTQASLLHRTITDYRVYASLAVSAGGVGPKAWEASTDHLPPQPRGTDHIILNTPFLYQIVDNTQPLIFFQGLVATKNTVLS